MDDSGGSIGDERVRIHSKRLKPRKAMVYVQVRKMSNQHRGSEQDGSIRLSLGYLSLFTPIRMALCAGTSTTSTTHSRV